MKNADTWRALNLELSNLLIVESFINRKLNKKLPPTENIFHYTNLLGLVSIIESQTIFCSNIYFLNDKNEYKYGVSQILKVVEKLKDLGSNLKILETIEKNINLIYKSERYVTCFSRNGDLLSQWRAYANDGKGVSIGFDLSKFSDSIEQYVKEKHIEYDEISQLEVIEELIKIIIDFYEKRKKHFDWSDSGYEWFVTNSILDFLESEISYYKHPSFKEEQEYRFEYEIDGKMIKQEDEEILFRTSESLIIPYIKLKSEYHNFLEQKSEYDESVESPAFPLEQLPINKIIIGPSLDFDAIETGIERLLEKNNYKNVEIEKSNISYRK